MRHHCIQGHTVPNWWSILYDEPSLCHLYGIIQTIDLPLWSRWCYIIKLTFLRLVLSSHYFGDRNVCWAWRYGSYGSFLVWKRVIILHLPFDIPKTQSIGFYMDRYCHWLPNTILHMVSTHSRPNIILSFKLTKLYGFNWELWIVNHNKPFRQPSSLLLCAL